MPGSTTIYSNCDSDLHNSGESSSSVVEKGGRKVAYIYDNLLAKCTDNIAHIAGRSRMTHELIKSYGLLEFMECKPGKVARKEDLLKFHSQDYIDFLFDAAVRMGPANDSITEDEGEELGRDKRDNSFDDSEVIIKYGISSSNEGFSEDNLEEFGLGYDCPVFRDLGEFALRIGGGTMAAAEELVSGGADIVINWCGGWHHAQRSEASGFCYVNDIVLGIHTLQQKFKRILYVDLDAHHGDGVENAFAFSNKVMTLSFHHFESGFFPGTGSLCDIGQGRGKYYSLNVPLKIGVTDSQFIFVFDSIFNSTFRNFQPEAVVVQCGADCLAKDPLGAFNLTLEGVAHCLRTILSVSPTNIPTLLLGGGGYNVSNAARLWTSLTAVAVNKTLNNEIPDNKYFLKYGADFELSIRPSLRKSENEVEYISEVIGTVLGHIVSLQKRNDKEAQS